MGMVQGTGVSLVMVRDLSAWKVGWDSRLLAATYSVSAPIKTKFIEYRTKKKRDANFLFIALQASFASHDALEKSL